MRLCRIQHNHAVTAAFFDEAGVLPLPSLATASGASLPDGASLLDFLPHGAAHADAGQLAAWVATNPAEASALRLPLADVQLLTPIARPPKLLLLAGNYAKHIEEGGEIAAERAETFPYVFMKPATTTLTHPGQAVTIPAVSPGAIDWELELAVVIGKRAKAVSAEQALNHVAGYTVVNDISNREFRPNPGRTERPRDKFFDWLHGKWHDSFCPCGPCIASPDHVGDPQALQMELRVNGVVKQSASTAQQIFSVAEVIEFISNLMTLEEGDIISTGTSAGVGNTTGDFLKPGDQIEAEIQHIGVLRSPVVAESPKG